MFISTSSKIKNYLPEISGFQSFVKRLREELIVRFGVNLDDYFDESFLARFYREGESPEFVAEFMAKSFR